MNEAITTLTEIIYNNPDNSKLVISTFLDLTRAFTTANHLILLNKLESYGWGIAAQTTELLLLHFREINGQYFIYFFIYRQLTYNNAV